MDVPKKDLKANNLTALKTLGRLILSLLLISWNVGDVYSHPALTLEKAEKAALQQSPEIESLHAKSHALEELSIAAGQLSDPKLWLGAMNLPVDTFKIDQEPMTQLQIGLQQTFPAGRSLRYKQLEKKDLSVAEIYKTENMKLVVLKGVRKSWLALYYWLEAGRILQNEKKVFHHLLHVAESMLANNKAHQKDVIRAQLELSNIDNKLLNVRKQIDIGRAQLARWIGSQMANSANPKSLPLWKIPLHVKHIRKNVQTHPVLKTDQSIILAQQANVKLSEQQYVPGFTIGATYGFRDGVNTIDNTSRPDFLSARIVIDLPIFPYNRQDRTLKASLAKLVSTQENLASHYRQLNDLLGTQYATWKQQQKSVDLFNRQLKPEAKAYAEATMAAYQNTQTDFPTLARAYVRELDTELAAIKAAVDRDIARINILYLQGK